MDNKLYSSTEYHDMPKMVYFLDDDTSKYNGPLHEESKQFYSKEQGLRGFFVLQPNCIKKPFIFIRLELSIGVGFFSLLASIHSNFQLVFYEKADLERCLSFVRPLRRYTTYLNVLLYKFPFIPNYASGGSDISWWIAKHEPFFNFSAFNDFLKVSF